MRLTEHSTSQYPACVGVDDRVTVAVSEDRDRAGRIVADAGQGEQGLDVARHDPAVPLGDLDSRPEQPERATRVSEIGPLVHDFRGRRRGHRRGCGPAREPRLEVRDDSGDRSLLKHEFADQDAPRAELVMELRSAPRQVSSGRSIPRRQVRYDIGRGLRSGHPSSVREP